MTPTSVNRAKFFIDSNTSTSSRVNPIYQLHNVWALPPVQPPFRRSPMVRLLYFLPPQSPQLTNLPRKIPWRISRHQKARQRARLRHVDKVVSIVDQALSKKGLSTTATVRWKTEMPTELEMRRKDKYTMFARYAKSYRKGIHSKLCRLLGS